MYNSDSLFRRHLQATQTTVCLSVTLKQTSQTTRVKASFATNLSPKSVSTRRFYALCVNQPKDPVAGSWVVTGVLRGFDGEFIDVRAERKFSPA